MQLGQTSELRYTNRESKFNKINIKLRQLRMLATDSIIFLIQFVRFFYLTKAT